MWFGGTVWLGQIRRRAFQDGRILLVETTVIALSAGMLNGIREVSTEECFRLDFPPAALIITSLLSAALWLAGGAALFRWARQACLRHAQDVLLDSGLLYLALEHDTGEALPMLQRAEALQRLSLGRPGELKFTQRIQALLAKYPAAANALGYAPYPPLLRKLEFFTNAALSGLLILFILLVFREATSFYSIPRLELLVRYFTAIIALILVRATLQLARATGLRLGLCNALLGEEEA